MFFSYFVQDLTFQNENSPTLLAVVTTNGEVFGALLSQHIKYANHNFRGSDSMDEIMPSLIKACWKGISTYVYTI